MVGVEHRPLIVVVMDIHFEWDAAKPPSSVGRNECERDDILRLVVEILGEGYHPRTRDNVEPAGNARVSYPR